MTKFFLLSSMMLGLLVSGITSSLAQIEAPGTKRIAEQVTALVNSGASFNQVSMFSMNAARLHEIESSVKNVTPVTLDFSQLNSMFASVSDVIEFTFPYDNHNITVELFRVDIFTEDFTVVTDKSNGEGVAYLPGLYYRGIVKGDLNSLAAFSFFEGEMMGVVSTNDYRNINIGKSAMPDAKSSDYVIYSDKNILARPGYSCSTIDDPAYAEQLKEYASGGTLRTTNCVKMYYEVDNNIYVSSGSSVTGTTNWMTAIHNNIATLYSNDEISTAISQVFVWTSGDPYNGSSSSSQLTKFKQNRPTFNGDVGQLVGIDPGGLGGVASTINGMCSSSNKYCYSDVNYSYSNVPTYSWTIEVCTHEFGHLLGSVHTQSCNWPVGALDNCYETEGFCGPGPAPLNGGTIMSYCHLTSYGINFNNGFGQYPAAAIQGAVDDANCLTTACVGTCTLPLGLNATSITSSSATLNWTPAAGATSYNIQYRQTGTSTWTATTSTTNSKAISGLAATTQYEFQVQTVCSAGTSAFSASANFTTTAPACVDNFEPNNFKTNPAPISLNTNINALINPASDKDFFSFSNTGSQKNIKVTLSTLPADYDIQLFNPSGAKVTSSENAGTESEEIIYNTTTVGTYALKVYGAGGAFNASQCYTLFITISSSPFRLPGEELANASTTIYPNPATGDVTVQYNSVSESGIDLLVYDLAGKIILQHPDQAIPGTNEYHLDLKHLSSGVYFLEVKNGNELTHTKFVIQR